MENVELPDGWAPGWGSGLAGARTNLTWYRHKLVSEGTRRLVVSFNWIEDTFRVYLVAFEHELGSTAKLMVSPRTRVGIVDGSPAFDDPVAAMIWAEVEYG